MGYTKARQKYYTERQACSLWLKACGRQLSGQQVSHPLNPQQQTGSEKWEEQLKLKQLLAFWLNWMSGVKQDICSDIKTRTHTHMPRYAGTSFAYISNEHFFLINVDPECVPGIEHLLFLWTRNRYRRSLKRKKKWTLTFMSAQDKTVSNVKYCRCHKGTTEELAINTKTFLFLFRFRCWLTCIFSKYTANTAETCCTRFLFAVWRGAGQEASFFFPFTTYMIW